MKTFNERFAEYFGEQGNAEQVAIFNEWAYATGNEPINDIDEFNEIMSGREPLDIVMMYRFGDFNPNDNWFTFNGYGNLESIENVAEWLEDYTDEMADYFEDHLRDLANVVGVEAWSLQEDEDEDEEEDTEEA